VGQWPVRVAKLFEQKFPPIERAGTRGNQQRYDVDQDDLDDVFAGRRKQQAKKEPPRREEQQKTDKRQEPNYDLILGWFMEGNKITLSDEMPFAKHVAELKRVPKLAETAAKYVQAAREEEHAFWMEMVLEGLHQALRLSREDLDSTITFQELMKFNVLRTVR